MMCFMVNGGLGKFIGESFGCAFMWRLQDDSGQKDILLWCDTPVTGLI